MNTQYVRHDVSLHQSTSMPNTTVHFNTKLRYVVVCDIETTTDFQERPRVSGYTLYDLERDKIRERGLITGELKDTERDAITKYAIKHNMQVVSHQEFIKQRLYPLMERGCAFVNHHIPFDIGGLATYHMVKDGMFYNKMCDCEADKADGQCSKHPSITIRPLASPKAIMRIDSDSVAYGPIIDTMIIGRALIGPGGMSLKALGDTFKCQTVKVISDDHGSDIEQCHCQKCDGDTGVKPCNCYLCYTCNDVQATLELFVAEQDLYAKHGLKTPITSILSEASIGKAYLRQLGIPKFYEQHKKDIPSELLTRAAMTAYNGAKSEVMHRLHPIETLYCDFKSEYPTVNALLGLQELLLAKKITAVRCKDKTQKFLDTVTLEDLQKQSTWKKLRVMVCLEPDDDIVPIKFKAADVNTEPFAICYATAPKNWYSLADAVASKLLTGKAPKLVEAIELVPDGRVHTPKFNLFGDKRYPLDLEHQDMFVQVINLRSQVKHDAATSAKVDDVDEAAFLGSLEVALKLLANSTAYGVLAETVFNNDGVEQAGKYFAGPVVIHITAGGRLLLAIAERLGLDRGIEYAACDTDSMMYGRSEGMGRETFRDRVYECVNWFTPLSPYALNADGSIPQLFELEKYNFDGKGTERENLQPLYLFGVSCKRYVLYNRNVDADGVSDGTYNIRKLSAHGAGSYEFDKDLPIPDGVPDPPRDNKGRKVFKDWQYLLWYRGIEALEDGRPLVIPDEEWSRNIARSQESVSTPSKYKRYSAIIEGIRPYSFFTRFPKSVNGSRAQYVTTYHSTQAEIIAADNIYSYPDMQRVPFPKLDTLADRFADFFNHPENKAANGDQVGQLKRRHITIDEQVTRTRKGKRMTTVWKRDESLETIENN